MNIGSSKKEKSRDDLQQNLQVSVNKIQILLSMERPALSELNGLLCGEGGLVQSTLFSIVIFPGESLFCPKIYFFNVAYKRCSSDICSIQNIFGAKLV